MGFGVKETWTLSPYWGEEYLASWGLGKATGAFWGKGTSQVASAWGWVLPPGVLGVSGGLEPMEQTQGRPRGPQSCSTFLLLMCCDRLRLLTNAQWQHPVCLRNWSRLHPIRALIFPSLSSPFPSPQHWHEGMCAKSLQLCPTLCDPMDCSPLGSSVHRIFQARMLEWVAISSSRGSSQPWDWTCISCVFWVADGFLAH